LRKSPAFTHHDNCRLQDLPADAGEEALKQGSVQTASSNGLSLNGSRADNRTLELALMISYLFH
jgi:hypothetical protein